MEDCANVDVPVAVVGGDLQLGRARTGPSQSARTTSRSCASRFWAPTDARTPRSTVATVQARSPNRMLRSSSPRT